MNNNNKYDMETSRNENDEDNNDHLIEDHYFQNNDDY